MPGPGSNRLFAPVAAPPPPKPPQLNLVASALMPDVRTDTFGPGAGPTLASLAAAGWRVDPPDTSGRRQVHRPAGDERYAQMVERWNALVAAVGVMDDLDMKQAESEAGVTVDSLPASIFPATASTRWTGGFAYAPENQFPGLINDPCGQGIDFLPALGPPSGLTATPSTTGGTLASGAKSYQVTAVTGGGQSTPTAAVNATTTGTTGSVALTWTANPLATAYNVYGRVAGSIGLLATVTSPAYTDTGAATVGAAPPGVDTSGGTTQTNLPVVQYVPFVIQVQDFCSTFGWEARDFTGRALRLLDNATPNAIEREFWMGAFAQNTLTGPMAGSNAFLSQSSTPANGGSGLGAVDLTPGGTPPSIVRGIQVLEDYLANTGFGGQGMIHVTPQTTPTLLGAHRVGALLLSVLDNIIVPGSGYPNAGATGPIGNANATPAAGTAWIYCSDLVSVRLDEPNVYPSTMAEATDRGTFGQPNQTRIRAQRFASATFDGARLAACRVTLNT